MNASNTPATTSRCSPSCPVSSTARVTRNAAKFSAPTRQHGDADVERDAAAVAVREAARPRTARARAAGARRRAKRTLSASVDQVHRQRAVGELQRDLSAAGSRSRAGRRALRLEELERDHADVREVDDDAALRRREDRVVRLDRGRAHERARLAACAAGCRRCPRISGASETACGSRATIAPVRSRESSSRTASFFSVAAALFEKPLRLEDVAVQVGERQRERQRQGADHDAGEGGPSTARLAHRGATLPPRSGG